MPVWSLWCDLSNSSEMNYLIHFDESFRDENLRRTVEEIVDSQARRLVWIDDRFFRSAVVDIYFHREEGSQYQVSAVANVNGEMIYLKKSGKQMEPLLKALFDSMKLVFQRKSRVERRNEIQNRRVAKEKAFRDQISNLQDLKKAEKVSVFRTILHILSSDVATYIRRRLKSAELTTAVNRGKFKVQELLNELYISVYERLEEVPDEESSIVTWVYCLADELLEKKFREVEFEREYLSELDHLVEAEYGSLEESFTVDGDLEIVPLEELNDFPEPTDWYAADDLIYEEDEDSLLNKLTLQLHQRDIHRVMEKELAKLPLKERTIMDLYLIDQMSPQEIAEIKGIPRDEVEQVVRNVNIRLKKSLSILMEGR